MTRTAVTLVFFVAALLGCKRAATEPVQRAPEAPTVRVFVGEEFTLSGELRCSVGAAEQALTEPRELRAGAEDLLVAKVVLTCRDAQGRAVATKDALPEQAQVLLVDEHHAKIAPSLRTRVSEHEPDSWVFELDPTEPALPSARTFDAHSGEPLGKRESSVAVLSLSLPDRHVAITLRQRELDGALDRWLRSTARALAKNELPTNMSAESARELERARALYARVVTRFSPRVLALHELTTTPEGLTVKLALEGASSREAPDPIALLTLVLERKGEELELASLLDEGSTLRALRCADELEQLGRRIERSFQAPASTGECNALGAILPGPCEAQDAALLHDALDTRARCLLHKSLPLPAHTKGTDDFQLTLRRGQQASGLDRDPRYVLALHPGGQVVFHGRHWVSSTERRDGRTTETAIAALLARFDELDWFERRGGEWDSERCSPEADLGNVLTLHARGRERMVVDREGCRGPFSARELSSLVQAIEAAAGLSAWTTPRPRYADPGVQVWTISAE